MIIEIGEKVVPDRGDKGDQGYPGMHFINSEYCLIFFFLAPPMKKFACLQLVSSVRNTVLHFRYVFIIC